MKKDRLYKVETATKTAIRQHRVVKGYQCGTWLIQFRCRKCTFNS